MKMIKRICAAVLAACCILPAIAGGDTLGGWATDVKNGKWQTGKLSAIATAYQARIKADPADYEARILHAATIIAQLGESPSVSTYAKKFGFTLNYLKMTVTGSTSAPTAWPAANTIVDAFVKDAVPALKVALEDLSAIPYDWEDSVTLSADEYPVDEDTAIDIGDVLYARAGIEAAIGTALFAQGYDLTADYSKGKAALDYKRTIPVGKAVPSLTTDDGWEGAITTDNTKMIINGRKLYMRMVAEDIEDNTRGPIVDIFIQFLNMKKANTEYGLCVRRSEDTNDYKAYVGNLEDVEDYCWNGNKSKLSKLTQPKIAYEEDPETGVLTVSLDLSARSEMVAADTLAVDWGRAVVLYSSDYMYEWYDGDSIDFEYDSDRAIVYKFLTEQTKFLSKVRNQASLTQSKDWMRNALTDALAADEAVQNRDDEAMHFVEYDSLDADALEQARNLTAKALVALDAPEKVDIDADILNGREAPFDVTLIPDNGVMQIYLGALFEGKIARDMVPEILKGEDGGPVPVVETIKDPTLDGLLPEATSKDWVNIARELGIEVAHQAVTVKLDANGGKVTPASIVLEYDEDEEGFVYPELPEPAERKGYVFKGWAATKDDIDGTLELEGEAYDSALFGGSKTPTLYAQWLKYSKITVTGGLLDDEKTSRDGLLAGDEVSVSADLSKELDKNEQQVNAFANWTYTPATASLGEGFDPLASDVSVTMPNADVKLTANFVNGFAAYLSMVYETVGEAEEGEGDFYWSVDNGKTLIPFGDEYKYPVKAGAVTVKFYDKTGIWRVPADLKLTVAKRGSTKDGAVTVYDDPEEIVETVTFMPMATSAQVKLDANGGKASTAAIWCVEGYEYGAQLPEVAERKGYEFDGWWTAKTDGDRVTSDMLYAAEDFAGQKTPTLYAQWLKYSTLTVVGGTLEDDKTSMNNLLAGTEVTASVDSSKELDANEQLVNAFANWSCNPATADLGENFDMFARDVTLAMPNSDLKLTANFVNGFAAYLSMTYDKRGEAEDEGDFYWSVDNGRTLIPFGEDHKYPVKAGAVTVKFYDKTGIWRAPADLKLTVAKRGSTREGRVTVWADPEEIVENVTFMPMATSAQVKFDANGGKASEAAMWCVANDVYGELPEVAARKGYIFAGWWTDKTDGVRITADTEFDADAFAGQKTPTVYARWLQTVKLTMKDESATAAWTLFSEDEEEQAFYDEVIMPQLDEDAFSLEGKGTLEVLPGALVAVTVDGTSEVKGKELVFQKWTVTPSKLDLGTEFRVTDNETEFTMPSEAVTLQATYVDPEIVCCQLSAMVYAASIRTYDPMTGEEDGAIEPPYESFEWSPDSGKTWYKAGSDEAEGEIALLKAGTYTVTCRSNDPKWIAPSCSTKVVLSQTDIPYEVFLSGFTYVPEVVVDVLTYSAEEETWIECPAGGTVTMNPKDGLLLPSKAVSLAAKAEKGYVFQGYAFAKTWNAEMFDFYTTEATWKLQAYDYYTRNINPEDQKLHVVAVFKAIADYSADDIVFDGIGTNNGGWYNVSDDGNVVFVNAVVGCEVNCWLYGSIAASPLSFKLDGKLPDGLKFDAKTGLLSGVPKKTAKTTFNLVASDPAKNSKALMVNMEIKEMPTWIAGEYRGTTMTGYDEDVTPNGLVEMSVKADGKVSAKVITISGTRSVSGALAWNDPVATGAEEESFVFQNSAADGSWFNVTFLDDGTIGGYADSYDKTLGGWQGGTVFGYRHDKDLFALSAFRDKYYTFAFCAESEEEDMSSGYGYLTLKTDKNGTAKVTGQLPDGEKVSMSALLLPIGEGAEPDTEDISAKLFLFASPSSYKKADWFAMTLTFTPDGSVVADEGAVWTVANAKPDAHLCCGLSAPEVDATITGFGSLYSEAKSLEDYYWTASCEANSRVNLEYSYKYLEENEENPSKPDSWTVYDYAAARDFDGMFFDVLVKGDKRGAISLAEKSPAPWEQTFKEEGVTWKEWNYEEDRTGKPITDPSQLSITFAKATGIFTGKATVYFDYDLPTYKQNTKTKEIEVTYASQHKTASLPYSGVMICSGEDYDGFGAALYTVKSGQTTSVVSLPMRLEQE